MLSYCVIKLVSTRRVNNIPKENIGTRLVKELWIAIQANIVISVTLFATPFMVSGSVHV